MKPGYRDPERRKRSADPLSARMVTVTWSPARRVLPEAGRTELAAIWPASCRIQAHAVHGHLGAVAELPGHEAGAAAADGGLSHGSPHFRHRIAARASDR
jgi:hypothetical protein